MGKPTLKGRLFGSILLLASWALLLAAGCQIQNMDSAQSTPVVDAISYGITAGISTLIQAALITLAT